MDLNQIIIYVMVFFMAIAAIDRVVGNPLKLGDKLEQAITAIGPLCIPMIGMIVLAPMLGRTLAPIIGPVFHFFNADPAMAISCLLACDMGGYSLAYAVADTSEGAQFSACILGTMLGAVITFMIPVGMKMVKETYRDYYAIGLMVGVITMPLGLIVGGFVARYEAEMILFNSLPVIIFSAIVALGLWKKPHWCIKVFNFIGYIVVGISTIGFAIGIVHELTPLTIIDGLTPIMDGFMVIGSIAIILCGAFPMVELIQRVFADPLIKLGRKLNADDVAMVGMIASTANIMPVLQLCNRMTPSGIVVAIAFSITINSIFGDFLGFVGGVDSTMIVPMIVAKIIAAGVALPLAVFVTKKMALPNTVIEGEEITKKSKIKKL